MSDWKGNMEEFWRGDPLAGGNETHAYWGQSDAWEQGNWNDQHQASSGDFYPPSGNESYVKGWQQATGVTAEQTKAFLAGAGRPTNPEVATPETAKMRSKNAILTPSPRPATKPRSAPPNPQEFSPGDCFSTGSYRTPTVQAGTPKTPTGRYLTPTPASTPPQGGPHPDGQHPNGAPDLDKGLGFGEQEQPDIAGFSEAVCASGPGQTLRGGHPNPTHSLAMRSASVLRSFW